MSNLRPMSVIDFRCDYCGKKLDAVLIVHSNVPRKIVKSYHDDCWKKHVQPAANMQSVKPVIHKA